MTSDPIAQALAALRQKDFVAARDFVRGYAQEHPLEFRHYLIKGLAELALKEWSAAASTFDETVRNFPHQSQAWFNLGTALENMGEIDRAIDAYEQCLARKPDTAEAAGNLSNLYRRRGRLIDAEAMARRALENGASKAQALNVLGLAVKVQGRFDEAVGIFAEALRAAPQDPTILANLANLAVDQFKFDEAWDMYAAARAVDDNPAIRHHEGMARLLAGDFKAGWPLYESRLELPGALRVHPTCPRWNGESLAGKTLMLVAEQGFGDTIQFCRYGRLLADQGATLVLVVRQPMLRLLAANLPGRVITENEALPFADFWLPLLSLPFALNKLRPDEAPAAPYLHVPDSAQRAFPANGKPRIGVVWSGSPTHERDYERSIAVELFEPLWKHAVADFVAPSSGFDHKLLPSKTPFQPLDPPLADFADTAALLASLDLLVTVDTAAAHLAGAIGTKTFLLLPLCPDWRWGISGETTAWYGCITLIRQKRAGDWKGAIDDLVGRAEDYLLKACSE